MTLEKDINSLPNAQQEQLQLTRDALSLLHDISSLLNTGLDKESLALSVSLLETGVNPQALSAVIKELKSSSASSDGTGQAHGKTRTNTLESRSSMNSL
jgi:mitotic-spindle organizing protein 1